MKKIVSVLLSTLIITTPLVALAQSTDNAATSGFFSIVETDGVVLDFDSARGHAEEPIKLETGKKYALIVSLDKAAEGGFSNQEILTANLTLNHAEEMMKNTDNRIKTLLSYRTESDIEYISDDLEVEVAENVIVQAGLFDGYSALTYNSSHECMGKEDFAATVENVSQHSIDLRGDEQTAVFILEVHAKTEQAKQPVATIDELDTETFGNYGAIIIILEVIVGLVVGMIVVKRTNH